LEFQDSRQTEEAVDKLIPFAFEANLIFTLKIYK